MDPLERTISKKGRNDTNEVIWKFIVDQEELRKNKTLRIRMIRIWRYQFITATIFFILGLIFLGLGILVPKYNCISYFKIKYISVVVGILLFVGVIYYRFRPRIGSAD